MYNKKEEYKIFKYRLLRTQEIAPGIIVYDDVIPGYESLIGEIEENLILTERSWKDAKVKSGNETYVNTNFRDTSAISIPYSSTVLDDYSNPISSFNTKFSNLFLENLVPIEHDYQHGYDIGCAWHDDYQILKYGVGQKFTNHIDDHPDFHRIVSTLYYLNDDYSGGEINFPRFDISFKPKANQMIIFPSTYVYNHSVSPVTEGVRYAVVSWLK
jgi:hypothetical protein